MTPTVAEQAQQLPPQVQGVVHPAEQKVYQPGLVVRPGRVFLPAPVVKPGKVFQVQDLQVQQPVLLAQQPDLQVFQPDLQVQQPDLQVFQPDLQVQQHVPLVQPQGLPEQLSQDQRVLQQPVPPVQLPQGLPEQPQPDLLLQHEAGKVCQLQGRQVQEKVRKGMMYQVHPGALQHRHIHVRHPADLPTTGVQGQRSPGVAAHQGADLPTRDQAVPQPTTDLRVPVRVVQEAAEAQ